jgi:peptidoglycan/LPS O-acetylase OafA/YrhL
VSLVVRPPGAVAVLDGIRAVAVAWVVSHHCFNGLLNLAMTVDPDFEQPVGLDKYHGEWYTAPVRAGQAGVDVFFVLSGFLIAFLVGKEIRRTGSVNCVRFLSRRWVRIIPAYLAAIAIYCTLTWKACVRWGWTNLLFLNNFVGPQMYEGTSGADGLNSFDASCMGHSWSIAVEVQMYLVSPVILLTMVWLGRWHWVVPAAGIAGCAWLRWALWHSVEVFSELETTVYNKPYTRIAPYLVGMEVAYLVGPALDAARRNQAWSVPCARLAPIAYWVGVSGWTIASFSWALWRPLLDPFAIAFDDESKRQAIALAATLFRPLFGVAVGLVLFGLIVASLDDKTASREPHTEGKSAPAEDTSQVGGAAISLSCRSDESAKGHDEAAKLIKMRMRDSAAETKAGAEAAVPIPPPGTDGKQVVASTARGIPVLPVSVAAAAGEPSSLGHAKPPPSAVCGSGRADPLWWCPSCPLGRWPASAMALGGCFGHRVWLPLARLSYSVYLLQWAGIMAAQFVVGWSQLDTAEVLWMRFMAVSGLALVVSMGIALLVYALVERPFLMLRERCSCMSAL